MTGAMGMLLIYIKVLGWEELLFLREREGYGGR